MGVILDLWLVVLLYLIFRRDGIWIILFVMLLKIISIVIDIKTGLKVFK